MCHHGTHMADEQNGLSGRRSNDGGPLPPVPERVSTPEQDDRMWELHLTGLGVRRIAAAMKGQGVDISATTVDARIRERMEALAKVTQETVELYRAKQMEQLDALLVESNRIARGGRCPTCQGDKTLHFDRHDPASSLVVCPRCDGTGQAWNETTRLAAINTVKGLLERQAKLTGLDAPERHELAVGVFDWTGRSDEELDREIDGLLGGPQLEDIEGTASDVDNEPGPPATHNMNGGFG